MKKNNGVIDHHWTDCFNDWINKWRLVELKNSSRSTSWFNNQEVPIMAALDRILTNNSFEQHYPLANVRAASRAGSDHVPLVIDFGIHARPKASPFRFEKWWLEVEGIVELIEKIWSTPCIADNPMDV